MGRGRPKKTPSDSLTLPVGAEAELRSNDPGFVGSFYEVTITGHLVSSASYTVAYATLVADDGGPLEETAAAADVCPRPPPSARRGFAVHDAVEAFHDEGWWDGVVSAVPGPGPRVYEVTFPTSLETVEFEETALRPHRVFQAGQWVPAAEAVLDDGSALLREGSQVEVRRYGKSFGESWSPASVLKMIGATNFLVQYMHIGSDRELATEIIAAQYIRPAQTFRKYRFSRSSHVEVMHEDSWRPGVLRDVLGSGINKYVVKLKSCETEMEDVECLDVLTVENTHIRPIFHWNGKKWVRCLDQDDGSVFFREGTQVEVRRSGKSFGESWSPASVLKVIGATKFLVQYMHIGSDGELATEIISAQYIRPAQTFRKYRFSQSFHVEVMHEHSWWPGVLLDVLGSGINKKYVVKLKSYETDMEDVECLDVLTVENTHVRPKFHWNGKKWVRCLDQISANVPTIACRKRPVSYALSLQKEVGETSDKHGSCREKKLKNTDVVSEPIPPLSSVCNESIEIKRQSSTCPKGKKKQGNAVLTPPSLPPTAGFSQLSVPSLAQNSHLEQAPSPKIIIPSVTVAVPRSQQLQASTYGTFGQPRPLPQGPPLGERSLNPQSPKEVIASNCIEEARKIVSMSEDLAKPRNGDDNVKLHYNVAAGCGMLSETNTVNRVDMMTTAPKDIGGSQHTVSQQGRGSATDSESLAIQHLLSFGKTSPVWARIDAMEIFSEMPQRPNLNQFQQHGPELREGMALGLMLSFANLAESICRLDVHQDAIGVLEEKEQGLSLLEENGFDVRVLRSRLEALLRTT